MVKCNDCKFYCDDCSGVCWKKEIINEFTGDWKYMSKNDKNSEGQCKDFKKHFYLFWKKGE